MVSILTRSPKGKEMRYARGDLLDPDLVTGKMKWSVPTTNNMFVERLCITGFEMSVICNDATSLAILTKPNLKVNFWNLGNALERRVGV